MLFSMTPAGKENPLHSFGSQTDGVNPAGPLLRVGSSFYGTTNAGCRYGGGTVYVFER